MVARILRRILVTLHSKISMRIQQCVRFARYARSLSNSVSLASLARQLAFSTLVVLEINNTLLSYSNWRSYSINIYIQPNLIIQEKGFPLQGERAHSLYFWSFQKQKQNREEGGTKQKQQTYQFTQSYNNLHRLQVHHLTLTFIVNTIYIHTYIYELF